MSITDAGGETGFCCLPQGGRWSPRLSGSARSTWEMTMSHRNKLFACTALTAICLLSGASMAEAFSLLDKHESHQGQQSEHQPSHHGDAQHQMSNQGQQQQHQM